MRQTLIAAQFLTHGIVYRLVKNIPASNSAITVTNYKMTHVVDATTFYDEV